MPILSYADEIKSPVLLIHGEKAHSRYFSEDTFKKLKGDNKELANEIADLFYHLFGRMLVGFFYTIK